ncbi:hypothetical protein ACIBH1_48660 [Nonomuraea sp. NPDC050663]|uniref:hypothetical protein n=1 Tax=Nonomuraea sp. NPDC050663 TaxID=3364370 RepID=UPI00379BE8B3
MIFQYCVDMPPRSRPRIGKLAGQKLVDRIVDRHDRYEEPPAAVDRDNPLAVLNHVLSSRRSLPDGHLADDVLDALSVVGYLLEEISRVEHELLEMGLRLRIPQSRMAEPLGLRSAQAVDNRIRRGRAELQGLPRNERLERALRLTATTTSDPLKREARWFDPNALAFCEAAGNLASLRRAHPQLIDDDLDESLSYLAQAVRDVPWPYSSQSLPALRVMAAWSRVVLDDLEEEQYALLRQEALPAINRVRHFASEHRKVSDSLR